MFEDKILERLDIIEKDISTLSNSRNEVIDRLGTIEKDISTLSTEVRETNQQMRETNFRVETYQKASQQVVNLAFGALATAVIAIVVRATIG